MGERLAWSLAPDPSGEFDRVFAWTKQELIEFLGHFIEDYASNFDDDELIDDGITFTLQRVAVTSDDLEQFVRD